MFRKKALNQSMKCVVEHLVLGQEVEIYYSPTSTGQEILDKACRELDILDKDYYGLRSYHRIQWLDMTKLVTKQLKAPNDFRLRLRFKYYPAEPALLANESTRYYLYLQLRDDLLEGRLRSDSQDVIVYLIACIMQSELGDSTKYPRDKNYISSYKFVPNQTKDLERESIYLHGSEDFLGLKQADAELNFLKKACRLDTYGIDPYPVKEGNSQDHFLIGVSYRGISTFRDSILIDLFSWKEIERISLDNKHILIYCRKPGKKGDKSNKTIIGFRCPSQAYAENFWKIATEHRYFFTLETTPNEPIKTNTGGLFRKSHKLKYVGRVEKDLLRDSVDEVRSSGVRRCRSLMTKSEGGWKAFQQQRGNKQQNHSLQQSDSVNDQMNKTLPPDMNYYREEDEDLVEEGTQRTQDQNFADQPQVISGDARKRSSVTSSTNRESPKVSFNRRPNLTTKSELATSSDGHSVRRGSQVYMEPSESTHDFIKASALLIMMLIAVLLVILLISDSDRPNSISLLVRRLNLEPLSIALRQNYYLPLKSALRHGFEQVFSFIDKKII